ncbi:MAG: anti-sigma F factor antagonist [Clostridiaceae bacterium]|nr:anti-sigma F factor antagonist [Clostridiaceae bacterium]
MQVSFKTRNKTLIAEIEGELDHHTSVEIKDKIDKEINRKQYKNLILDFTKLTFMDSSGVGVIIGRYKNIQKRNGKMLIVNPNPQVNRIITISGVHKIVPVFSDMQGALEEI